MKTEEKKEQSNPALTEKDSISTWKLPNYLKILNSKPSNRKVGQSFVMPYRKPQQENTHQEYLDNQNQ